MEYVSPFPASSALRRHGNICAKFDREGRLTHKWESNLGLDIVQEWKCDTTTRVTVPAGVSFRTAAKDPI